MKKLIQYLFVLLIFVSFWGVAPCQAQENLSVSDFLLNTGVDQSVTTKISKESPEIERRNQLPRKIVTEATAYTNSPQLGNVNVRKEEQTFSQLQGGLIYSAVMVHIPSPNIPSGISIYMQNISYLGLVVVGTSVTSGIKVDNGLQAFGLIGALLGIPKIPMPFSTSNTKTFAHTEGLKTLDLNLAQAASPAVGQQWRFSTSKDIRIEPGHKSISQHLSMECETTEKVEASTIHPSFSGSAQLITCVGKADNGNDLVRNYAFLEDYKWYFTTSSSIGQNKTDYVIKELEM